MSWTDSDLNNSDYCSFPVRRFESKYPGVVEFSDLEKIERMQALFKVFEDANYRATVPSGQIALIEDQRTLLISTLLVPLRDYNPRVALPFNGMSVDDFVAHIDASFNSVYAKLAATAAIIKSELFDYEVVRTLPDKNLTEAVDNANEALAELREASKKFPKIAAKINSAESIADEWIDKQDKVLDKLLETKSRELDSTADHHGLAIQALWAVASASLGILAFAIGYAFLDAINIHPDTQVTVGFALYKLAAVLTPIGGAYICYSQYTYHRSMYDALKFRALALSNLATLSKQYPDSKNLIFERGISLIFDEPRSKQPEVKINDITELIKSIKG